MKKYITKQSSIKGAGKGLFTNASFKKGEVIGLAHVNGQPTKEIGSNHNHNEKTPTANNIKNGNKRYLIASRNLKPGEEITTNYRLQPELEQPEDFQKKKGGNMTPQKDGYRTYSPFKNLPYIDVESDTIDSNNIVYDLNLQADNGLSKFIEKNTGLHTLPGAKVIREIPVKRKGGRTRGLIPMPKPSKKGLASKKYSRSLEATNRLFTENKLFEKPKSRKNKVFDPRAKYYQDGGQQDAMNAMMKARLAYANEFGNPAAQRMINMPDNPYEFENGDTGTHYMSSMDNYAVPQIQDENGQLMLGDYGPESEEAMRFESDDDANYFAEHYKDIAPGFVDMELDDNEIQQYVKGGYVVEEVNNPSVSKLNTFAGGGETQCGDNEKWDDRLQKCVKIVQNLSESTHYDPAGKKVQATLFQKLKDAKDAYQNFTKQHRGKKYRLNEADSASSIEQLRKGIQLYKDEYAKEQEQTKHELKKLENLKSKAALKDNKDIQNLSLKDLNTVKGKMKIENAIRNSDLDSRTVAAIYTGFRLDEVDKFVKPGTGPNKVYSAKEAEANAMKNVPEFVDMVSKVATAIPLAGTAGALAGSVASAATTAGRALAPAATAAGKVIFNPVTQGILAAPALAQMALHPVDTITGAATTGVELYDKAMGDKDDVNRFGNPYWQDMEHLVNTAALLPGIGSIKAAREFLKTKKGFDFAVKYVKPVKDFYKKGVRKYIKTTAPILNTNVPGVAAGVADSVIGGRGATEVVNRAGQLLQNVPEWAVPTVGNTLKGIGYATAGYTGVQGAGNIQEGLSEGNKEQFDAGIAKTVDAATTLATLTPIPEVGAATQPLLVLATAKEIKDNIAKEETGSTAFNTARIINQIAGLPTSSNQILPRQSVKALRRLKVKHIRKHLKKGGVVSELSQKEIDDLVAQGYIIEELD